MQSQRKTVNKIIAFLLVIFMMCPVVSFGASAYAESETIYYFPDKVHNTSSYSLSDYEVNSLKEYLRSELVKTPKSVDVSGFNLSVADAADISSVIYDELPEIFHISGLGIRSLGDRILSVIPQYTCSAEEFTVLYNECLVSAEKVLSGIKDNDSLSDVQKALLIHDRIALLCEYDCTGFISEDSFTMYGALVKGVAVCQGYSEAYLYLLEQVGIESHLCESEALNHAWNIVEIDGQEYHVDVTWDDPIYDVTGRVLHTNFLRSSAGIYNTGHTANDYNKTPDSTTYDNYFWQNSSSAFQLAGDEIYYIDKSDSYIKKYSDKSKVISVDDYWDASEDSYWPGNFSYLASDGVRLFYNKSDAVYMFDLSSLTQSLVWEPDKGAHPYMRIYGFTFADGKFICDLNNSPNFNTDTKKLYQQEKPWRTVKNVTIEKMPDKTQYYIGDEFNPAGLSLRVFYSDGTQEIVKTGYTVTFFDSSREGKTYVHISYAGRNLYVSVDILLPSITLSEKTVTVEKGKSAKLSATTIPAGQTVIWSAENDNVSVLQDGTVTSIKDGTAEVTATFIYQGYVYSAVCKVSSGCTHKFISYHFAVPSTCVEHGHDEYAICDLCNTVLSGSADPLPLADHEYIDKESEEYLMIEPTCTTPAVYYKSCSVCGEASSQTFESEYYISHEKVIVPAIEPTCTLSGLTAGAKCSLCGMIFSKQEVVEATGHNPEIIPGKPSTETETGLTDGQKCSVCGVILVEQTEIPKLDHVHTYDVSIKTGPTCTESGYTTYKCICGHTYTADEISATGHKEVSIPAVEPSCMSTGLTEGKKCSVCEKIITEQKIVNATGHIAEIITGKPATETETGLTDGQKCSVCGVILVEQTEIPKIETGHTHDFVAVVTEPDCTTDGYTTYTCICGYSYTDNVTPATGHKEEIIPATAPTCTENGLTEGMKCSVCEENLVEQKTVAATGHDLNSVVTKPTCTQNGYTVHTCSVCAYSYTDKETKATGHKAGEWKVVTAAQAGKAGLEIKNCTVCGEKLDEREIAALEVISDKLEVKGDLVKVDESKKTTVISIKNKVGTVKDSITNKKIEIVDKDGNAIHGNSYIGTGSQIQILDNSGKVINTYTVVVPNDVDGNGKTTAADARLALRKSAKLENFEGVYASAADVTGDGKVTAADARQILRVSAGLAKP